MITDPQASLPRSNSPLARLLRDLDRRIRRLEPRESVGLLRDVQKKGATFTPNPLMQTGKNSGGSNLPRYR